MEDVKKRWSYLSRPAMNDFLCCQPKEKQQRYLKQLSEREQEVIALSLLTFYMQQGSFLQFFSQYSAVTNIALRALGKIKAELAEPLLRQGYQILQPTLQNWPDCTMQELLHHLTETEKQQLHQLNQAYLQVESQIYLQAFRYYAG